MKRLHFIILVMFFFCFSTILCNCVGPKAKRLKTEFYNLNYDPPSKVVSRSLPFVVSIEPFQAAPPYDTTRIIYITNLYTINSYSYHEWIAAPAEIIPFFIARDLEKTDIVQAVMISDDRLATHRLTGIVETFCEKDLKEEWKAILSLNMTLVRINRKDMTSQICFQKNYSAEEICLEKNSAGLTRAMSICMSKLSEALITDIYNTLSK